MRKIIDGYVDLSRLCLKELFDLSDVEVITDFYCNNNDLTSLKGSPHTVGGDFDCNSNDLTSLKGSPHTVGGDFDCCCNKLTSIEGLPKTINHNLVLDISLKKSFNEEYIRRRCKIGGQVYFVDFQQLEPDEDPGEGYGEGETPKELNHVNLSNLKLTKLPNLYDEEVTGNFDCSNNFLTNLIGSPKTIQHSFLCDENNLTSLEGIPSFIGGGFFIDKELKDKFPEEYIRSLCTINGRVRYL